MRFILSNIIWLFSFVILFAQNNLDAEYFFDTDPGLGNGFQIALTSSGSFEGDLKIPTENLNPGHHVLFTRIKDDAGKWSTPISRMIYVERKNPEINTIKLTFKNNNAIIKDTVISVVPTDTINQILKIGSGGFPKGVHLLEMTVNDQFGKQSFYQYKTLLVERKSVAEDTLFHKAEYYFDDDPGYGNGHELLFTSQDTFYTFKPILNGIRPGFHYMGLRGQMKSGRWAFPDYERIYVDSIRFDSNLKNLVAGEYFFDSDPGVDNGNVISISPDDSLKFSFNVNTTGLVKGIHSLSTRFKDTEGKWSGVVTRRFYLQEITPPKVSVSIKSCEYFIGDDPGVGNGENVPVTNGTQITESFTIDLTGYSTGVYKLSTRALDENNQWSVAQTDSFTVVDCDIPNIPVKPSGMEMVCDYTWNIFYRATKPSPNDSLIWELSPSGAGNIKYYGDSIDIDFINGYSGEASLKVKAVNSCTYGNWSEPLVIKVVGNYLPAPSKCKGPTVVCVNNESSQYTIERIENAIEYQWELEPATAGSLVVNDTSVIVQWNANYTGITYLRVRALNVCAGSSYSPDLEIEVKGNAPSETPTGDISICRATTGNIYKVDLMSFDSTNWSLSPPTAGEIIALSDSSVQLNLTETYVGEVSLVAQQFDSCIVQQWSEPLNIKVTDTSLVAGKPFTSDLICGSQNYTFETTQDDNIDFYEWKSSVVDVTSLNTNLLPIDFSEYDTVYVKVRVGNSCVVSDWSDSLMISRKLPPSKASLPIGPDTMCTDNENIFSAEYGFADYEWRQNGGYYNTFDTNLASFTFYDTTTMMISVRVNNGCGWSEFSDNKIVKVLPAISETLDITGEELVCGTSGYTYSISGSDAKSIIWRIEPTEAVDNIEEGDFEIQVDWSNTFVGNAIIYASGLYNCGSGNQSVKAVQVKNHAPVFELRGSKTACPGDTVELSYNISNGFLFNLTSSNLSPGGVAKNNNQIIFDGENENLSFVLIDNLNINPTITLVGDDGTCVPQYATPFELDIKELPGTQNFTFNAELIDGSGICNIDTLKVNLVKEPGHEYLWSTHNAAYQTKEGIDTMGIQILGLNNGQNFTIEVIKSNLVSGCKTLMEKELTVLNTLEKKDFSLKAGFIIIYRDTTPGSFQWYLDDKPLEDGNKQFYLAREKVYGNYKVEVVSKQGCVTYADTVLFKQRSAFADEIYAYPNPNKGMFLIDLRNADIEPDRIEVFNVLGEKLFIIESTKPEDDVIYLSDERFQKGVNIIKLIDNKGNHQTLDVLINK